MPHPISEDAKDRIGYWDVVVYADGVEYRPSENYALELVCTKAGGWQLWYIWEGKERQIGGEFFGKPFCITVRDMVIVGTKPEHPKPPEPFGWSGFVERKPDGQINFGQ